VGVAHLTRGGRSCAWALYRLSYATSHLVSYAGDQSSQKDDTGSLYLSIIFAGAFYENPLHTTSSAVPRNTKKVIQSYADTTISKNHGCYQDTPLSGKEEEERKQEARASLVSGVGCYTLNSDISVS